MPPSPRRPAHRPLSHFARSCRWGNAHVAGIDVGAGSDLVAFCGYRAADGRTVGECETSTANPSERANWLTACSVEKVAAESTGVSRIALFEVVSTCGFDAKLVDPRRPARAHNRRPTEDSALPLRRKQQNPWLRKLDSAHYGTDGPPFVAGPPSGLRASLLGAACVAFPSPCAPGRYTASSLSIPRHLTDRHFRDLRHGPLAKSCLREG